VDKPFQYQFEWDATKARQNVKRHRVTFERAATVFLDPNASSLFDDEHSHKMRTDGLLSAWTGQERYLSFVTLTEKRLRPARGFRSSFNPKNVESKTSSSGAQPGIVSQKEIQWLKTTYG
jgi:uncharacterized DUF497 family protein